MPIPVTELRNYLQNEFKQIAVWEHNPLVGGISDWEAFVDDMQSTRFQSIDDIRQAVHQVDQERKEAAKNITPFSLLAELTYTIAILDIDFQKKRYPAHSDFFAQFRKP